MSYYKIEKQKLEQNLNDVLKTSATASSQTITKPNVRCIYGYKQLGNRYYWKRGASKNFTQGFKSKEDAISWIEEERQSGNLDWTAGFTIKLKNQEINWVLEDKSGSEIKY